MRPGRLRKLLEPYGTLGRIYLKAEDASLTRRRKKFGKGGKQYTEGWVEFEDKRKAKRAALILNGHPYGGSTRRYVVTVTAQAIV